MKNHKSLISRWIIVLAFTIIQFDVFSETKEQEWCPDVTGMWYAFDRLADDVVKRRDSAPFLERNFYEHILWLPVGTNMPHFVSLMGKKRELLKKAQDRLEYCKTNEMAYLQLAVHLGLLLEIPTNTWYTEGMQAHLLDAKERDMSRIKKGLPPGDKNRYLPIPAGACVRTWEKKWRVIPRWNSAVRDYRQGVLADLRETLLKSESRLERGDARDLRLVFPRTARLTEEEKEFVFGPAPKTGGIPTSGTVTNITTTVP